VNSAANQEEFPVNRNDLFAISGSMLATFFLTLFVGWPGAVEAIDPPESGKPLVAQPVLKAGSLELSVSGVKALYKAGEIPALELQAINKGTSTIDATATLTLMITAPSSPMSRVLPIPMQAWRKECPLSVAAGQTKTIALPTNVALASGKSGYFVIKSGIVEIFAAPFRVEKDPAAQPAKTAAVTIPVLDRSK
jgi:hypothetical protein